MGRNGHQQISSAVLSTAQRTLVAAKIYLVWPPSCVTVRGPKRWDDRWSGASERESYNDIKGVGRTPSPPIHCPSRVHCCPPPMFLVYIENCSNFNIFIGFSRSIVMPAPISPQASLVDLLRVIGPRRRAPTARARCSRPQCARRCSDLRSVSSCACCSGETARLTKTHLAPSYLADTIRAHKGAPSNASKAFTCAQEKWVLAVD